MDEKDGNTEQKILEAARIVFIRKGKDGARMQEIADEAGINKAMLHYYFRNKEKLFDEVFKDAMSGFIPKATKILSSEAPFEEKIKTFVSRYIDLIFENPYVPGFIINELNRDPRRLISMMEVMADFAQNQGIIIFQKMLNEEVKKGKLRPIDPRHLIVNLIGLCIFPFRS